MLPLDLAGLGAAYWTGNGHKWLCGPKGSAVLHVRADRRETIRPLVVSHGWNDVTPGRSRFRKEFDWVGTVDPTAYLALADAVRIVGELAPGGWPAIMASNHELAVEGRRRLVAAGLEPSAPEGMVGSMVAVRLPGVSSEAAGTALERALATEDGIEVPVVGWPVRAARANPADPPRAVLLRISAQRYNDAADVDRLVVALRDRLDRLDRA
jgi:isopenicillin-N epimerase